MFWDENPSGNWGLATRCRCEGYFLGYRVVLAFIRIRLTRYKLIAPVMMYEWIKLEWAVDYRVVTFVRRFLQTMGFVVGSLALLPPSFLLVFIYWIPYVYEISVLYDNNNNIDNLVRRPGSIIINLNVRARSEGNASCPAACNPLRLILWQRLNWARQLVYLGPLLGD